MDHLLPARTRRLTLRRPCIDDVDSVYAYQGLPEVAKYLYRPCWTRDQTAKKLTQAAQAPFTKTGHDITLMVQRTSDSAVLGETRLHWRSVQARQAEVGYVFNPDYRGHGYATEAAREMLRLGFTEFGFHRIFARLDEENLPSRRVCERLGMRQEARLVESDIRDGVWGTELVYALLHREW